LVITVIEYVLDGTTLKTPQKQTIIENVGGVKWNVVYAKRFFWKLNTEVISFIHFSKSNSVLFIQQVQMLLNVVPWGIYFSQIFKISPLPDLALLRILPCYNYRPVSCVQFYGKWQNIFAHFKYWILSYFVLKLNTSSPLLVSDWYIII